MKSVIKTASALLLVTTFAACTHYTLPEDPVEKSISTDSHSGNVMPVSNMASGTAMTECTDDTHYINAGGQKVVAVKVRATGYGAPPKSFYSDPQRRLMAMRAAKVDAYRSLAERINGVQIWGGTTLGDMVVEKDRFRVYLDTTLRGARVIAENPHEDGSFETIVEVSVDQSLLSMALPAKASTTCMESSSKPEVKADKSEFKSAAFNVRGKTRTAHLSNANFYYTGE
jgi:hypothetical protein